MVVLPSPIDATESLTAKAWWGKRRCNISECIRLCHDYLTQLATIRREFSDMFLWGNDEEWHHCPSKLQEFERLAVNYVSEDDTWYVAGGTFDTSVTLESNCPTGFNFLFGNRSPDIPAQFGIHISCGKYQTVNPTGMVLGGSTPNSVVVTFPSAFEGGWYSHEFAKKLLLLTIATWRPQLASVSSGQFDRLTPAPHFPVGWMTYCSEDRIRNCVPRDICKSEMVDSGGMLLSLCATNFSSTNSTCIEMRSKVFELLDGYGLLSIDNT